MLLARSSTDLKRLLYMVKCRFDELKLVISDEKSQIISPDDETWELFDGSENVEMSLQQVSLYK